MKFSTTSGVRIDKDEYEVLSRIIQEGQLIPARLSKEETIALRRLQDRNMVYCFNSKWKSTLKGLRAYEEVGVAIGAGYFSFD